MHNGLVYLRPSRLIYVRATGPYETSIPKAWDDMLSWIDRNGFGSVLGRGVGMARDNPSIVPAERCRYDACIEAKPQYEDRALRELGMLTMPGGPYVRQRKSGGYDAIRLYVTQMHATFQAPNGLRLDDNRPLVTFYLDDPRRMATEDLRADVCMPVTALAARTRSSTSKAA
jgi:AraC family transcriptional regulator